MGIDITNPTFIAGLVAMIICIIAIARSVFQIGPDNKKERERKERILQWRENIKKQRELENSKNKTK